MNRQHDRSAGGEATAVGVDAGATLAKLAIRRGGEPPAFALLPADSPERVARAVQAERPDRVGLTGPGATAISRHLSLEAARVNEFTAWGAGVRELLAAHGAASNDRYLLVSVGTGTSIMLIDGERVTRVGGTALGGGTVQGLGAALVGTSSFSELCELARRGSRRSVDLLISDIYPPGEIALDPDFTASAFAKLARRGGEVAPPAREDLAGALMRLVAENVGLICGGLAAACGVDRVVFGGATLLGNPVLVDVLEQVIRAYRREPTFLERGEFVGALGALRLAEP